MKKGISLIVLVITIIVMIIIAGAIILSLNSSNVTNKAKWATIASDRANYQSEFAVILADYTSKVDGEVSLAGLVADTDYIAWEARVEADGFTVLDTTDEGITDPAGVKVTLSMTTAQATAYGIVDDAGALTVDWVELSDASST